MDANKRHLFEVFTGNRSLEIPFFQRDYVWDEPEWERLLRDVEEVSESRRPYFLGPVILKQRPTPTSEESGDVRVVIDGQQRLTTLNILFKVLSQKKDDMKPFDKRFRLDNEEPVLNPSHNDSDAFFSIMENSRADQLAGQHKLSRAYRYFDEHLNPDSIRFDVGNLLHFVLIDLGIDDDEQQIFDTINSLGVRLTTAELLKNYFFQRDDIKAYNQYWKDVFEKDEITKEYWDREITAGRAKRSLIDLFFFSFLQIKIQDPSLDVSAIDKNTFSKVEKLFDSYKTFIKTYLNDDKESILKEIRQYAITFSKAINPDAVDIALGGEAGIDRINGIIFGLDTTTLIPYILFVEQNVPDVAVRNELYEYLESYIMRRIVTRATNKAYNQLFSERLILNRVLTKTQLQEHLAEREDSSNKTPVDTQVIEAFGTEILTNKNARGVLYMIETKLRNEALHSTSLLGLNKYSLEHIMPKKWHNKWNKPRLPYTHEDRDRLLLTLGNLTIITQSLNASIRDANWTTKKRGAKNKGGLKTYSEGIEILTGYLDESTWDEELITKRARYLANEALEIWKP